ncbi:MAG: preprotein translocase subunit SecG [Spirochaetales bacterium]|nr:preprotein translocase subunit SecG [Spirochaetales bacterium]
MNTLLIVLSVFVLIDALLIIGAILLQEDKSGGGIGIIGGSSQSFLGSNSGSMLSKITTVLVTIFVLLIVIMGVISSSFTKSSSVSAQDIEAAEAQEYEKVKLLTELPGKITESDFQKNILDKITNESDKSFINEVYTKAQQNKYYELDEKTVKSKDAKTRALGILNGVGYTLEAAPVEVNSVLTNDVADTTND